MAIPNLTVIELINEGITIIDSLAKFDKEMIEQIAHNLHQPAGRGHFVLGGKISERKKWLVEQHSTMRYLSSHYNVQRMGEEASTL